jgi:hypothetical protein
MTARRVTNGPSATTAPSCSFTTISKRDCILHYHVLENWRATDQLLSSSNSFTRFRGEDDMTVRIIGLVGTMVMTLGATTALAQPLSHPFAQVEPTSLMHHSLSLRPYDQTSTTTVDGAHVGDGSAPSYEQDQRQLMNEPGYSIGTGAAQVSGGS